MQPMNYTLDVKSPFETAINGVQAGFNISNAMDQSKAKELDMAQKQLEIDQHKAMTLDLAELAQKPDPTAQDYAAMTVKYPSLAEHFKNTWSMLNADQQQSRLGQATQIYAALNAGKPEIAAKLAADQRDAFKNSGKDADAQAMDTLSQLITQSPETARTSAGLLLSSVLGPEKFSTTFSSLEKLPGEVKAGNATATQKVYEANNTPERLSLENKKTAGEMRNIDSQIADRSARLGLDRDKLQTEVELKMYEFGQKLNPSLNLDGAATKLINDSTISSVANEHSASRMNDLAAQLDKEGGGYGTAGTVSEWLKKSTGNQDAMTALRQDYARIRSGEVSKMLPPGVASDKDIALAMEGFPSNTADSKTIASFLRGMAKLSNYTAISDNAKAEWVNAVGHLGKPRTDINIDGVAVPAGTPFTSFARQYVGAKVEQKTAADAQAAISGRSYMRHATPAAGAAPGALGSGTYPVGQ